MWRRPPSSATSESKEFAVAEGITAIWIAAITDAVRRPAHRSYRPWPAGAACQELAVGFEVIADQIADLERQTRESMSLRAWTLLCYLSFETAIAETIAPTARSDRRRPAAADDRCPAPWLPHLP